MCAVGGAVGAAVNQLGDGRQAARPRDRFRPGTLGDRGNHCRVVGAFERRGIRKHIAHTFECSDAG